MGQPSNLFSAFGLNQNLRKTGIFSQIYLISVQKSTFFLLKTEFKAKILYFRNRDIELYSRRVLQLTKASDFE